MSKTTWIVVAAVIVIGALGLYWYQGGVGSTPASEQGTSSEGTEQSVGIANPASTHCIEIGGTLEIMNEAAGQAGYCHMPDGSVCEEWALFRDGSCKPPQQ